MKIRRSLGNGKKYAAVLLGLDGTLIDSTAAITRAWEYWAAKNGVPMSVLEPLLHGRQAREVIAAVLPEWDRDEVLAAAAAIEVSLQGTFHDSIRATEGAAALLACLGTARWAVVTSCSRNLAEHYLSVFEFPEPPVLVTADDVRHGKPHPQPYLTAAVQLGVEPNQCLAIEDAPAGAQSAQAAGCSLLTVATTHPATAFTGVDVAVNDLTAVAAQPVSDGIAVRWN